MKFRRKHPNQHKARRRNSLNRRKELRSEYQVQRRDELYELIDGNKSYYPYGYCWMYKQYMTIGLCNTHRCIRKECRLLEVLDE